MVLVGHTELQDNSLPSRLVDHLTYRSYAHNRRLSPQIQAHRWELVYGPATNGLEEQFQSEEKEKAKLLP